MRDAFRYEIELLIDVNSDYGDRTNAKRMARELEPLKLYWFEDSLRFTIHNHIEDMARLSRETNVPLAMGGNVCRNSIKRIIEHGGINNELRGCSMLRSESKGM